MVVQPQIALFSGVDSYSFRNDDLVVRSEQRRNLILINQIVDILQHETVLQLRISQ